MALEKAIPKDVANAARQHVKDSRKGRERGGCGDFFSHSCPERELGVRFSIFFMIEAAGEDRVPDRVVRH